MFEKLLAARMNHGESSSTERLIAGARELRDKHTLHADAAHFASYLRLFDNFFELLICESHWGAAQLLGGCCGRFPTIPPHVAFL
jgi:hypothetical protein